MNNYLTKLYNIDAEGNYDEISIHINCWEQIIYNALKNYEIEYEFAFCDQINLYLNKIGTTFEMECISTNIHEDLYKVEVVEIEVDIFETINTLLDSGEILGVATAFNLLPPYIYYDEESIEVHNKHFMTMIGRDEEEYYFVESPLLIAKERNTTYFENPTINVIKKEVLQKAFKVSSSIRRVFINKKQLSEIDKLSDVIGMIIRDYKGEGMLLDSSKDVYVGRKAFQEFIKILKENKLGYTESNFLQSHFPAHICYSRRMLLKKCLEKSKNEKHQISYIKCLGLLDDSINKWSLLKRSILKNIYIKDETRKFGEDFRKNIIKIVEEILIIEDELISCLEQLY
ncbi:MAG: hypothetical protein RR776_02195 [Niameybacter sp.]|uniref:hypothetical protein n=1 Tax=Niameybacter sp. TaxID=2033640 RepID=UPI002FC78A28